MVKEKTCRGLGQALGRCTHPLPRLGYRPRDLYVAEMTTMRWRDVLPLTMTVFLAVACTPYPAAPEHVDSGSTSGAGDAPGNDVAYPAGPYGYDLGEVAPNLTFEGLRNPKAAGYDISQTEVIAFSDFYNPTGDPAKPRVLVVTSSVRWCEFCKAEASESMGSFRYWNPKGVTFLNALMETENPGEPATPSDLRLWTKTYQLEYPVVLDPSPPQLRVFFSHDAPPFNMVVDTTTMKILFKAGGLVYFDSNHPALNAAVGE